MSLRARCSQCRCFIEVTFIDCCRRRWMAGGEAATLWNARCPLCRGELRIPFAVDLTATTLALVATIVAGVVLVQVLGFGWASLLLALPLIWAVAGAWRWCWVAVTRAV